MSKMSFKKIIQKELDSCIDAGISTQQLENNDNTFVVVVYHISLPEELLDIDKSGLGHAIINMRALEKTLDELVENIVFVHEKKIYIATHFKIRQFNHLEDRTLVHVKFSVINLVNIKNEDTEEMKGAKQFLLNENSSVFNKHYIGWEACMWEIKVIKAERMLMKQSCSEHFKYEKQLKSKIEAMGKYLDILKGLSGEMEAIEDGEKK